jgi:DNA topoisomerase-3
MKGRGLGTEATRSAIIQRLLELEYVTRTGKVFDPTAKGIALIAQALPHLASPELTGDMEAKLGLVEEGKLQPEELLREVAEGLRKDIPAVFRTKAMEAPKAAPIQGGKDDMVCPKCKAGLVTRRQGQAFYGCARFREGCNFTVQAVVAGKTLTEAQVKELVRKGRTKVIKGFKSKAGKDFDAMLVVRDGKTEFEFER